MPPKIQAGRLRHAFDLMKKVPVEDDLGGKSFTLEVVHASLRGSIEPLSSREALNGLQRNLQTSHRVTIRFRPAGLDSSWVLKWGSRYLSIVGIRNLDERNRVVELDCEEGLPQGVKI